MLLRDNNLLALYHGVRTSSSFAVHFHPIAHGSIQAWGKGLEPELLQKKAKDKGMSPSIGSDVTADMHSS